MIIITATKIEADPVVRALGLSRTGGGPFQLYSGGAHTLAVSGIGKANCAMCVSWLSLTREVTGIINIGAAGAVREGIAVGDIFQVEKVYEPDRPMLTSPETRCYELPAVDISPGAVLSTMDRPVLTDDERAQAGRFAHIVDMEGAGFVQACRRFGVSPFLFKYVTDTPGSSKGDIISNIRALSADISDFVLSLKNIFP
jgi:nucleoside phosphorylase